MASAGDGTAEFVKEGERLQPKVIIIIIVDKHSKYASLSSGCNVLNFHC